MARKEARTEILILQNAMLKLEIRLPSGRMRLTDKVTHQRWAMDERSMSCGRIGCELADGTIQPFHLGRRGRSGVLFSCGGYSVRAGREDDYEEVVITGTLQIGEDDPANEIAMAITFSVSRAFPHLVVQMRLKGSALARIRYIAYPLGFALGASQMPGIIVPEPSAIHANDEPNAIAAQFDSWQPAMGTITRGGQIFSVAGPLLERRPSALIGYLENPNFEIETNRDESWISATPLMLNPAGALADWKRRYRVRYTVVPDAVPEAIAWMFHDYLNSEMGFD